MILYVGILFILPTALIFCKLNMYFSSASLKTERELRVGRGHKHEVHFVTQGEVVSLEFRTFYQCKL
jgi:hypothetical protein